MGLLDIWNDWREEQRLQVKESNYGKYSREDLDTAGGITYQGTKQKRGQFTTDHKYIREKKEVRNRAGKIIEQGSPLPSANFQSRFKSLVTLPDGSKQWMGPNEQVIKGLTKGAGAAANTVYKDNIMQGGAGVKQGEDPSWWNKLANMANVDMDKAMASWKDKGGFEGLMANPAFTMGLAFMQAGAEGKTLGQGALDNVMKAGGISQHYKKIIEDRKQKPISVTSTDVAEVKDLLKTLKYDKPNIFEKGWGFLTKGDTGQAAYDQAAEHIAVEVQKEMARMQANYRGKEPLVIDIDFKKKAIENVLKSDKIKKKEAWTRWTSGTIKSTSKNPLKQMARGGPVQAGKPYVVGEEGPEIIIPHSSGNVLSNDDSQIYAMLLAANPQLQKVSKTRAERILRSRFPEYFE